jgi:hypothetical protein
MMQEKVKGMLKGMSMPKKKKMEEMPEGMVEGEEEGEEGEVELSLEGLSGEGEGEEGAMEQESSILADVSDEELMAEIKKRGIEDKAGGAGLTPLPPYPEDEEEKAST